MNNPAGPGAERPMVWSAGTQPTIQLPEWRPLSHRRRALVLGAAAVIGVLAGVVTTWAEISPVRPTPDTHLWIAPGTADRMSEVRPRSAPSPAMSELARAKMSELTVVPLTRGAYASRSASPDRSPTSAARARQSAEEPREAVSKPSSKAKPMTKPPASASPRPESGKTKHGSRHSDGSRHSEKRSDHSDKRANQSDKRADHSDKKSKSESNSGKGSKDSGHSASDNHSGSGS